MNQQPHYREIRVFTLEDVDGHIHALNQESWDRGDQGCWVCARVMDLGSRGHMAIYVYLQDFAERISAARSEDTRTRC